MNADRLLFDLFGAVESALDTRALMEWDFYNEGCDCMACMSLDALHEAMQAAETYVASLQTLPPEARADALAADAAIEALEFELTHPVSGSA